jgi:hypothetical protein
MACELHRHGGAGAMDPRHLVCQDCCSSAREVKLNGKPRRHSGATISQAGREFNSKLAGSGRRLGAGCAPPKESKRQEGVLLL